MAVGFVLVPHLAGFIAPSLRGVGSLGHFGVLIFFVHTSLVLMLSMERMQKTDGSLLFVSFYIRRFFRIYPLSIFAVLCAALTGYGVLNLSELLSNLSLTMNLTESKPALVPLWSLPYEVDMYLFLPVLFLFANRFRSPWATFCLILACSVLALAQLGWSGRLDMIQYVGCFLPGIMAYQISRPRFLWPAVLWPVFLVILAIVFAGLSALHLRLVFVPRWTVCLLLGLAAPQFQQIPLGLIRRAAGIVAQYSYGIYLLHMFAMHISFVKLAAWPIPLRVITFVATMVAFPFAAYHLIEKPGINVGKRLVTRRSR